MKIAYNIDKKTIEETKSMLRSEIKSRPISMSQIFYAECRIESDRNGDYIEMGRIPLAFFLIDLIFFLASSNSKHFFEQTINDENQDYTVYLQKNNDKMTASFVKNGGIKSLEFDFPNANEISKFARIFIAEYIELVPELKNYSNLKYIYEELNV